MGGTREGGLKSAVTLKSRYGDDYHQNLGKVGGKNGHTGGFAANPVLASMAGVKGGRVSSRAGIKNGEGKSKRWQQGLDELKAEVDSKDNNQADVE